VLTRLDHLVILVSDLDLATADYGHLGFAVTPGGEHADGLTRNALIPFGDGSYFELVSFLDPEDPKDNVWGWRAFLPHEGLIDYCVASDDLESDVWRLRSLGFGVDGPDDGGRRHPDGVEIRWRSARLRQDGRLLPFLIEDLTLVNCASPAALRTSTRTVRPASPDSRSQHPTWKKPRPHWACCSKPIQARPYGLALVCSRRWRRKNQMRHRVRWPWSWWVGQENRRSSILFLLMGPIFVSSPDDEGAPDWRGRASLLLTRTGSP
jgi:Glyoxalase-like domain